MVPTFGGTGISSEIKGEKGGGKRKSAAQAIVAWRPGRAGRLKKMEILAGKNFSKGGDKGEERAKRGQKTQASYRRDQKNTAFQKRGRGL